MLLLRLAPYEASLLLTLVCLGLTWQRRQFPGARFLAASLACQSLYIVGYLGEVVSSTLASKICWDNFQWLPSLGSMLLLAMFVRDYTRQKPLPPWLLLQLGIVPLAMAILAFTNPWHHYVGTSYRIIPGWPAPALYYEFGKAAWLTMPYLIGLLGLSVGTMTVYVFAQQGVFRRQALGILIGLLLPTLAVVTAVLDVKIAGYRDVAPIASAVGNLFILWSLLRHRALRLVPMARELVFEHIQVGVLVVDESEQIVDVNPSAATLFGTTQTALLGQSVASQLVRWPQVLTAIQVGRPARIEEQHQGASTSRWTQIDIQPIHDDFQSGYLLLLRDITDQKRAAEEVLVSREAALLASKAKSRFVATLSHEIRTPLGAVMGISRLLYETKLEPEQQDLLRKLDGATHHLLELLNHTLDFSKLEAGRLELAPVDFNLGSLLTSISEIFWLSATDKGIRFSISVGPEVPQTLHGDGLRLKQILVNLIGNAIKFTDQGSVELRVTCPSQSGDESVMLFVVEDTGIGLDPGQQASLFQPFSQADPMISTRFGGTGLGLSISRQLAQLFGGDLSCESQKGVGSSFRLRIKLKIAHPVEKQVCATCSADSLPAVSSGEAIPRVEHSRVLLAEDNQINQVVTQKMLRRIGYDCDLAITGLEAIRQLSLHPPDYYAAVLMDLQLPELSGRAAVVQIRADARFDTLPIIALTGESASEVILDVLACGMDDIMNKPIDLKTLSAVLKRWTEAKRKKVDSGPGLLSKTPA